MTKWLIVSLAVGSLAACSSDEPGPKKTEDTSLRNATAFCTTWAKAACNDTVVSNCDEVDTETCVEHQSLFCQTLIPAGYSSKRAQDCINAVKAAYADAELTADELNVVLHLGGDCSHLVSGGSAVGDVCSEPTDCDTVNDYSCVIKAGDPTGTCQIPKIEDNGEPCDGAAMVCNAEAYCDGDNCLVRKAEGKTCSYDAMCEDGDRCDVPTDATAGTCSPKLALKADCTSDLECASNICLSGTQKCTSKVVLTGESSVCLDL